MDCYLCERELSPDNQSNEHIIPAGLGNNIVDQNLLCRKCNNELGSQVDSGLVKQLGVLYGLVTMARPGTRPDDTVTGMSIDGTRIKFSGELEPRIPIILKLPQFKQPIKLTALRSQAVEKAIEKLQQLRNGVPELDIEDLASKLEFKGDPNAHTYFSNSDDPTQSAVGGPPFFRAIKKIAVNFYLYKGGDRKYIQHIIQQVKTGNPNPTVISKFYYPTIRPVYEPGETEVSHIIKLVGDPIKGVLYCYVSLFNTNSSIILLNDQYDGPAIDHQYHYDLITRAHLTKEVSLPVKHRGDITDHFVIDRDMSEADEISYKRTRRVLEDLLRKKGLVK